MHAWALSALEPALQTVGARVLDIGSGSGYLTAALAYMVDDTGFVVGIEHVQQLADMGLSNINKNHKELTTKANPKVKIVVGDGR
jgi:protein-L-isoaspartate(D-aspartate) O-methyltransferase